MHFRSGEHVDVIAGVCAALPGVIVASCMNIVQEFLFTLTTVSCYRRSLGVLGWEGVVCVRRHRSSDAL